MQERKLEPHEMNVVMISPHFPEWFSLFSIRLAELGANVLGITDNSFEELPYELRRALKGHYNVHDLSNVENVLQACRFFTWNFGPLYRVESHIENWLPVEAKVRDEFELFGKKSSDIPYMTRKSLMKEIFRKSGVAVARGQLATTLSVAMDFASEVGYPLILKPDVGVGASDTYKIDGPEMLERIFAEKVERPGAPAYFLEEFIYGGIESFDGLTDHDGNIVFCTAHRYSNGVREMVENNENIYYISYRDIPADLEEAGRKTVRAFDVREKFFHIEMFRTPEGKLFGLEVNIRPPGGHTTDMFNYACDIDVYRWWAEIIVGLPSMKHYERKYHVAFVSRRHDREYVRSTGEILSSFKDLIPFHGTMPEVFSKVMGNECYIVRSPKEDEVMEVIKEIHCEKKGA